MKKLSILSGILIIFSLYACDVDKTKSGELPSADVEVETNSGELPEYDVEWVDLNIGTRKKTIKVPTVEVFMDEKEVEVPFIDANWPTDFENVVEQTINVEAEVTNYVYDLEIDEIYAKGDRLIVISSLEKESKKLDKEVMRVNDQIVINAPELTVKHYIMGMGYLKV